MFLTTNGKCIEELSERRDGIIFDTNISWAFWKVLMAGGSWQSSRRMQKIHGQPSSAFGAKALIVAGLIHFGIPIFSPKLRQWWWWPCVCSTGFARGLSLIIGTQQAKFEGDCWYDLKVMLDRWLDRDMTAAISCIRQYHCKNHFDIQNSCLILEYKKIKELLPVPEKGGPISVGGMTGCCFRELPRQVRALHFFGAADKRGLWVHATGGAA